jgi:4-amino-4-deoxy-L-arabinose transferase-like glycosyltransferase
MMESALMLFSLLTVLAGAYLLRRGNLRGALLLGLSAGLAVASKHTAIMAVLPVFVAGVLVTLAQMIKTPRAALGRLMLWALAGVISLAVFWVMNPAWWNAPLTVGRAVLDLRTNLLANQAQFFPNYADTTERLEAFWRNVFIQSPQYYEVSDWAGFIGGQIDAYHGAWFSGVGGSEVYGIAVAALAALGLIGLLKHDPDSRGARWIVFVWALGAAGMVLALTTFEWQRYYIPVILPVMLLAGNGVAAFVRWIRLSNLFTLSTVIR